jgi:hypothetical protein
MNALELVMFARGLEETGAAAMVVFGDGQPRAISRCSRSSARAHRQLGPARRRGDRRAGPRPGHRAAPRRRADERPMVEPLPGLPTRLVDDREKSRDARSQLAVRDSAQVEPCANTPNAT